MVRSRNEVIGTVRSKTLGYAVQGLVFSEVATLTNPGNAVLIRTSTKYGDLLSMLLRITLEQI